MFEGRCNLYGVLPEEGPQGTFNIKSVNIENGHFHVGLYALSLQFYNYASNIEFVDAVGMPRKKMKSPFES